MELEPRPARLGPHQEGTSQTSERSLVENAILGPRVPESQALICCVWVAYRSTLSVCWCFRQPLARCGQQEVTAVSEAEFSLVPYWLVFV